MRGLLLGLIALTGATSLAADISAAQELTQNPSTWRPINYADLRQPSKKTATYADIWKDALEENNRSYKVKGDTRYGTDNAPATEAHFVIWSAQKSVVMSVLDTAGGCTVHYEDRSVGAIVKLCPMRLAFYDGLLMRVLGGGKSCFLELLPTSAQDTVDPTRSVAYAAYDVDSKTIRTGMIVNHKAVEGCSNAIPLYPQ